VRAAALALLAAALAHAEAGPRPALMAPLAPKSTLLGLAAAGERVVAVGQRGHILVSDDGRDFRQVAVPVNSMLNRVRFRDAKAGWAVGHDATILATTDGGATWTLQHFDPEGRPLYELIFLGGGRIVAVGGYGTWLVSSDDGASWEPRSFPVADLGQHFNAAARLADGSLLVAGERGLLARSPDDGETWQLLDSPYNGSWFGVLPAGERGALVFGLRGHIYLAEDVSACPTLDPLEYDAFTRESVPDDRALAQTRWQPLPRPTGESLFGGARDGDGALLAGVNGVLVRVDPAAATAALLDSPAPETLNDLLRHDERWLGVGRRGIQDLGTLP
jgi:hypothetical protein